MGRENNCHISPQRAYLHACRRASPHKTHLIVICGTSFMKTASVRPIIFSVEHDLWDDTAQHGAHVTTASSAPDVNMPILMTDVTYCNSLPLTPVTPFLHFEQFNCHFSNPESPTDPRSFQPYTHMLAIFLMFEFFFFLPLFVRSGVYLM